MKLLLLSNCSFVKVDDDVYEWASKMKWHCHKGYPCSCGVDGTGKHFYLARLIMKTPKGMETDHHNHDILDNQRENLRVCTRQEDTLNRIRTKLVSERRHPKYVGVYQYYKRRWQVQISIKGKTTYHGIFSEDWKAALVYNMMSRFYLGKFAYQNQIDRTERKLDISAI